MVEHTFVKRLVAGSNPACGVFAGYGVKASISVLGTGGVRSSRTIPNVAGRWPSG
jgi:hypothetical protein